MIHEASLLDIPRLTEMGRHFAERAAPHVGFDKKKRGTTAAGID